MGCLIPNSSQPESKCLIPVLWHVNAPILRDMLRCNEIKFGMFVGITHLLDIPTCLWD